MSWAGYEMEQLRYGVDEICHLRYEKQENCFAEVTQNANYGERHSSKVAKRVAHKNS